MATNQTGIAIVIKAFLPIGKTLDQQLAALTLVKTAHETSDYAALLAAAKIDDVKTEQKTRRTEEQPVSAEDKADGDGPEDLSAGRLLGINDGSPAGAALDPDGNAPSTDAPADAEIPAFLKTSKKKAA